jgi:hypothetical protein
MVISNSSVSIDERQRRERIDEVIASAPARSAFASTAMSVVDGVSLA